MARVRMSKEQAEGFAAGGGLVGGSLASKMVPYMPRIISRAMEKLKISGGALKIKPKFRPKSPLLQERIRNKEMTGSPSDFKAAIKKAQAILKDPKKHMANPMELKLLRERLPVLEANLKRVEAARKASPPKAVKLTPKTGEVSRHKSMKHQKLTEAARKKIEARRAANKRGPRN